MCFFICEEHIYIYIYTLVIFISFISIFLFLFWSLFPRRGQIAQSVNYWRAWSRVSRKLQAGPSNEQPTIPFVFLG